MKKINSFYLLRPVVLLLVFLVPVNICLAQTTPTPAPAEDKAALRVKAMEFVGKGQYIEAFPLLEKLSALYPDDPIILSHYGIAILSRSQTLTAPAERKAERIKGYNVLLKAKKLGTVNALALDMLDQLSPDGEVGDGLENEDPEFEKNMREGEGFFGRGDYDKAYASYEKAYKLNPKSYEAMLFMADSLYAAKKYKESEPLFAKAVELGPDREQAYRYWGDALLYQKKYSEARDKFIEALIADPFSRIPWETIGKWVDESGVKTSPLTVVPPGSEVFGEVIIDDKQLKAEDGTAHWRKYNEARAAQLIARGRKPRLLADEVAALRKVAEAVRAEIKTGQIKYPDKNLINLVKLDDAGLLEAYVLMTRADENIAGEYEAYRKANREKLRRFVIEFLLGV